MPPMEKNYNVGLLIMRLGLGAVFIAHGAAKFQDLAGTIEFFNSLGFAPFFAYLVAGVELLGGLAILTGLWVKLAGFLLAVIMAVAIIKVKWASGFFGFELDFSLLALALGLIFTGPGTYQLLANKNK